MKTKDYVQDIRTKSEEELSAELTDAKKELFNLRFRMLLISWKIPGK